VIEDVRETPPEDRSIGELVSDLTEELKRLVRDELRLAVFELKDKGRRLGLGAGLFGTAGILALFGGATLVAAAVLALSLVLPGWLAALIVGGGLLVFAGFAGLVGRKETKRAVPPVPEESLAGVREDVQTVKRSVQR
jgi:uncharacterized membrane protein YqjE